MDRNPAILSGLCVTEGELEQPSLEVRAEREKRLLDECYVKPMMECLDYDFVDTRPPSIVEALIDRFLVARLNRYRPDAPIAYRQDILCLCCGVPYRPDDVMDGLNCFLCSSCILSSKEDQEWQITVQQE